MPVDNRKEGLHAAIEAIGAGEVPEASAEQQDELFELPDLPLPPAIGADRSTVSRGRGRPKGSANRRTTAWTDYLLARYRSPLEFLAETFARRVEDLARELSCTPAEAFDLQLKAAKELAPFLHQKQPLAVDVTKKSAGALVIMRPDEAVQLAGQGIDLPFGERKQNQQVIDGQVEKSDGEQSDEAE